MARTIFLLRHAEPEVINGERHGLTSNGKRQALAVATKLAEAIHTDVSASTIYSPVERCEQTALVIGKTLQLEPTSAPLRFLGIERLKNDGISSKYSQYMERFSVLGIESPHQYAIRFTEIIKTDPHVVLVVVANEVNIRVLLQHFNGKPYNKGVDYAACFKIVYADHKIPTQTEEIT